MSALIPAPDIYQLGATTESCGDAPNYWKQSSSGNALNIYSGEGCVQSHGITAGVPKVSWFGETTGGSSGWSPRSGIKIDIYLQSHEKTNYIVPPHPCYHRTVFWRRPILFEIRYQAVGIWILHSQEELMQFRYNSINGLIFYAIIILWWVSWIFSKINLSKLKV